MQRLTRSAERRQIETSPLPLPALLLTGIIAVAFIAATALAQKSSRIPTVGVVTLAFGPDAPMMRVFRQELIKLGYVDGETIQRARDGLIAKPFSPRKLLAAVHGFLA